MGRRASGQVVQWKRKRGLVFGLRFRAYGRREYLTLGTKAGGWTLETAEAELQNVLADVRRGIWQPRRDQEDELSNEPAVDPTFHAFASEWLAAREHELRPNTVADYKWRLEVHLLPFFAAHRLSEISVREVDRFRNAKVRHGELSASSINKFLMLLSAILEVAVEYELIPKNPAKGKRRRLKQPKPHRAWLQPDQVTPLLDASDNGRAILATLVLAGLRIGELIGLKWRDVDLATGKVRVGQAKTEAGVRTVDLSPDLRDEVAAHKASSQYSAPDDLVFCTRTGKPHGRGNLRVRVLRRAVRRANERLADENKPLLPEGLTPHSLRHTFASLLFETGASVPFVMAQLGHSDPKVTLSIYAHVLNGKREHGERLDALVNGGKAAKPEFIEMNVPNGGDERPRADR